VLAHLYAAQALIQLSRISEATNHLDPIHVLEYSFTESGDSGGDDSGQKNGSSVSAARTVFQFNLIVAFAMRGELDKAESLLEKLWNEGKDEDKFGIQPQMMSLRLYIQLAKGNVERCRELAVKHCPIVSQK